MPEPYIAPKCPICGGAIIPIETLHDRQIFACPFHGLLRQAPSGELHRESLDETARRISGSPPMVKTELE
jgi:hypothetical protein